MNQPPSKQCICGYVHPPPWNEDCPVLQNQQRMKTEKGQEIQTFCSKLVKILDSREDYKKIIERVEKIIQIYQQK